MTSERALVFLYEQKAFSRRSAFLSKPGSKRDEAMASLAFAYRDLVSYEAVTGRRDAVPVWLTPAGRARAKSLAMRQVGT